MIELFSDGERFVRVVIPADDYRTAGRRLTDWNARAAVYAAMGSRPTGEQVTALNRMADFGQLLVRYATRPDPDYAERVELPPPPDTMLAALQLNPDVIGGMLLAHLPGQESDGLGYRITVEEMPTEGRPAVAAAPATVPPAIAQAS